MDRHSYFGSEMKRTITLRRTFVIVTLVIVFFTALSVGIFGYRGAKNALEDLWSDLGVAVSRSIEEKVLRYFFPAIPVSSITNRQVEIEPEFIKSPYRLMDYSYAVLQTNEQFDRFFLAQEDGSLIGAIREGDTIKGIWYVVDSLSEELPSIGKHFVLREGKWELESMARSAVDPLKHPFWRIGKENRNGAWIPPFRSLITNHFGYSYTYPQYLDGEFLGVWLTGFRREEITHYLNKLAQKENQEIYLLSKEGEVIDHSSLSNPEIDINKARSTAQQTKQGTFKVDGFLGYIRSFSNETGISWDIVTLVPERVFQASIRHQRLMDILIAGALAVGLALLASIFFSHISKQLNSIAFELKEMGELRFTDKIFSKNFSLIKEVNIMYKALDFMKNALTSLVIYLPKGLMKTLIEAKHPSIIGGTKKEITILVSDLVNFTSLSEKNSPQELLQMLGTHLEKVSVIIDQHQGVVDKYVGDAIMAFWGAPSPLENHELHGCRAALEIKKSPLKQRIGIASGEVIVGNIGTNTRMEYTALGENVDLANSLEGLSKIYGTEILISEKTAKAVQNILLVRCIDYVPMPIFELIGELREASKLTLEAIGVYTEALNLYQNKQLQQALEKFEKANILFGGHDGPSLLFIKRIK